MLRAAVYRRFTSMTYCSSERRRQGRTLQVRVQGRLEAGGFGESGDGVCRFTTPARNRAGYRQLLKALDTANPTGESYVITDSRVAGDTSPQQRQRGGTQGEHEHGPDRVGDSGGHDQQADWSHAEPRGGAGARRRRSAAWTGGR